MVSTASINGKALTQAELSRELNVSRQAINDLVSRGILQLNTEGRIALADAQLALADKLLRPDAKTLQTATLASAQLLPQTPEETAQDAAIEAAIEAAESTQTSYHQARALRETFEAKLKRLRFEQEVGASIELADAKRIVFTAYRTLRDQLLNVPVRIKDQCAAETDPVKVEALIEAEMIAALNAFDPAESLRDLEEDDDAELADAPHDESH
jgi:transcriptional regulator with XRE-family HTH domain